MDDIPRPRRAVRGSATGRPIMALLDLLGRRWALRVIWELREAALTFRALQASCGSISSSVLNERLAEAYGGSAGRRIGSLAGAGIRQALAAGAGPVIGARTAHARGRYPRRRVHVDEHTISLDDSPVYYRSAKAVTGAPPLYLHGVPTSSDDWTEFLARTGGLAPDLIGLQEVTKWTTGGLNPPRPPYPAVRRPPCSQPVRALTEADSPPILRSPSTTKGGDPVSYTKRCHLAGIAR